jgi:hypothetical protein
MDRINPRRVGKTKSSSTTSATNYTKIISNTTFTGSREENESRRLSVTVASRRKSRREPSRTQSIIILEHYASLLFCETLINLPKASQANKLY